MLSAIGIVAAGIGFTTLMGGGEIFVVSLEMWISGLALPAAIVSARTILGGRHSLGFGAAISEVAELAVCVHFLCILVAQFRGPLR